MLNKESHYFDRLGYPTHDMCLFEQSQIRNKHKYSYSIDICFCIACRSSSTITTPKLYSMSMSFYKCPQPIICATCVVCLGWMTCCYLWVNFHFIDHFCQSSDHFYLAPNYSFPHTDLLFIILDHHHVAFSSVYAFSNTRYGLKCNWIASEQFDKSLREKRNAESSHHLTSNHTMCVVSPSAKYRKCTTLVCN